MKYITPILMAALALAGCSEPEIVLEAEVKVYDYDHHHCPICNSSGKWDGQRHKMKRINHTKHGQAMLVRCAFCDYLWVELPDRTPSLKDWEPEEIKPSQRDMGNTGTRAQPRSRRLHRQPQQGAQ